jgi:GT2 family glycosyltransferase
VTTGAVDALSIDVLVVAFGAPALLDRCLASLGDEFAVTVIDNSSNAEVRAVAEAHGSVYIDPGRNLGFASGVNAGLARQGADAVDVLLLNPDAAITSGEVRALHRCLHRRADAACVAPAQTEPETAHPERVAWPFPSPFGAWLDAVGLGHIQRAPGFVIGSVLLIRAAALEDVGSFDEQFFLYAEETDWQWRAHLRGWQMVYCDEVTATHVGAGTSGDGTERSIHFHASQERYIRKHHGSRGWLIYRSGVMAGAAARALVLHGERKADARARLNLYRRGPLRVESEL